MLPPAFLNINAWFVLGLPITALYVVALAIILWLVTERMPIGRQLYAIGASPKAAALNGIPVRRYLILSFVASGFLTACTGVILASKLRIGQTGVGLEYLLPALVGVFLGSTTIKPGRVNVWGTVVAVLVLAVGISGIQQFGGEFYVGRNLMTLARITTARRQITSSVSRSRGRNGPPGDSTSRPPAAEGFIGHPLDEFLDIPAGFPPETTGSRAHMRSVRPGATLADQAARSSSGHV